MTLYWEEVDIKDTELEGPFQCPACSGHIMVDATYIDQVEPIVVCPYCYSENYVKEKQ